MSISNPRLKSKRATGAGSKKARKILTGGVDGGIALILDIDVFTTHGFELDDSVLERRLSEMRWLKNKVFFGSITEKAFEMFR